MSECHNPDCKKKKLIDGFPVLKEGPWSMNTTYFILGTDGSTVQFGSTRILNISNDGRGFVSSNSNETTVNAIGTWKKSYKNYDLYLVMNDARGGNFVVSPLGYKDGEVSQMKGINIVGSLSEPATNQTVGQVQLEWNGNNSIL